MISCFMIVKNVMKQGYPFAEAIASALPMCDEFLISDGYSTDGTFETLRQISLSNKKIKIFRYNWPKTKSLTILADATNAIRKKCKFEYIFYVQANEIVHEADVGFIKALPEMLPEVHTFCFPYLHLMGNYKFAEEFRLRFSKNLNGIVAVGDSWALGPSKAFITSEALKGLRNPRKFLRYIGRGIEWTYANSFNHIFSRAVYLPKPLFRYWSLFPSNFLEKCKNHAEMFGIPEFYKTIEILKEEVDDYCFFWQKASKLFRAGLGGVNYPDAFGVVNKEDHPKIMQDFVLNHHLDSYYVREKVLESIRAL
jgi:glycosyltransferase involved in cell wall biosynthesis